MRKRKFLLSLMATAIMTVTSVGSIFAGGMSNYTDTPALTAGVNINTEYRSFCTDAKTATGPNTWVSFTALGSLSEKFQATHRYIYVYLMEHDKYPNAHDKVREYSLEIPKRTITSVKYVRLLDKGNIDSEGDNQAELYLSINVGVRTGDQTKSIPAGLFKYKYGID